jgi:putative ABC transport system permease protein
VGICRARTGILSRPLLFTTYDNAVRYVPLGRKPLTWILVKARPDADVAQICRQIEERLGLAAFPADRLRWETMKYIMLSTSIGMNFLCTIALGFMVGLVVSTAAFNQFTSDNLPHYATLKAIGTPTHQLVRIVVLQGLTAGLISYGIGLGLAALASLPGRSRDAQLTAHYPWQLLVAALVPMLICVATGSIVSLWRVLRLDPAVVFQS